MPHRSFRIVVSLVCALIACACKHEAPKKNVLLISIDTLRADRLGCYGYQRGTTPRIDDFAKTAVLFEAAHASAPWTLPSLSSMLTGLAPSTHGVTQLDSWLPPEHLTIQERLRNAGWDTALIACHVFLTEQFGLQQGFTHIDEELVPATADHEKHVSSSGISERAIQFLERKSATREDGVPWMLWLHYFDPHWDYVPHAGLSERFGLVEETDLYDGEIAFTDQHVGRVIDALARLKLDADTIVILTADHGEEFGEHEGKRHGTHLHQEVVRIPLLVRAPGVVPARRPDVVGNVDIAPTIAELCGLPAPQNIQGASLVPLFAASGGTPREVLMEVTWRETQYMRALRREQWSYHDYEWFKETAEKLFDVPQDPLEATNLAKLAEHEALRQHMAERLRATREQASALSRLYPAPTRSAPSGETAHNLQQIGYAGEDGSALRDLPAPSNDAPKEPK